MNSTEETGQSSHGGTGSYSAIAAIDAQYPTTMGTVSHREDRAASWSVLERSPAVPDLTRSRSRRAQRNSEAMIANPTGPSSEKPGPGSGETRIPSRMIVVPARSTQARRRLRRIVAAAAAGASILGQRCSCRQSHRSRAPAAHRSESQSQTTRTEGSRGPARP